MGVCVNQNCHPPSRLVLCFQCLGEVMILTKKQIDCRAVQLPVEFNQYVPNLTLGYIISLVQHININ